MAIEPTAPPVMLRRRIGETGRLALADAWALLQTCEHPPRLVLSSRHGEYDRTLRLLDELIRSREVSPADFSLSVHHALAGLLSIATRNTAGHTAISAGRDTFPFALIEAAACAAEDCSPVLLMHFDEPLPALYDAPPEPPVTIALLVMPGSTFTMTRRSCGPNTPGKISSAEAFARMLIAGTNTASGTGERGAWEWCRD